jgi:hypothetical protein
VTPLPAQPVGFAPDWQRASGIPAQTAVLGPVLQRPRLGESQGVCGLRPLLVPVDLFGGRECLGRGSQGTPTILMGRSQ